MVRYSFRVCTLSSGCRRLDQELKSCLTSRYPRDRYILTDKLTADYFKTEADIRPFFERQLEACGVDYFDFYLMHAQGLVNYDHFKQCRAYETTFALKAEGKVRHVGISFHDRAEVLEQTLVYKGIPRAAEPEADAGPAQTAADLPADGDSFDGA